MAALGNLILPISPTAPFLPDHLTYIAVNDLYIALSNLVTQLNASGPVMMSPNGHYWKATISNTGTITWSDVGTTRP